MKKKLAALLLALLLPAMLASCGEAGGREPKPAPDLTGEWKQAGNPVNYYQIARITEDHMELYWFVVEDSSTYLYWTGSFTPPETGDEPYTWTSVNDLTDPDNLRHERWALRNETKNFTYKNGHITYNVDQGHLRTGVTLEKVE